MEAVWRIESAKLIAALARLTGDLGSAEELAQDALVAAMEQWPVSGIPRNPGAWLMATAKHRAIDATRRRQNLDRKHQELGRGMEDSDADWALSTSEPDELGDDVLRLMFVACHPVLNRDARVALTLRLVAGLTTEEIARAFLTPTATIAQRIVRAKRTLGAARVPFEVPTGTELEPRLASVMDAIYLIFNEGYAATSGESLIRSSLCEEALRLGRMVAALAPEEPEAHGLVALMELQASRLRTRTDEHGMAILLTDQDRARWDQLLMRRGLAALGRAERLGGASGPFTLQAAIAACHARAASAPETNWVRIVALYDALSQIAPSPVVELNRAVAVGMAFGPEAGLAMVDDLVAQGTLSGYHLLPAVRGDLLAKTAQFELASAEFVRAALLTENVRERELLLRRAADAARQDPQPRNSRTSP